MKRAAAKTTTKEEQKLSSSVSGMTVAVQLLDTSWRVALPIVILSWLGIHLDHHYHHKILFTVTGICLSLIFATILVYKQIKLAYPEFFTKDHK